MHIRQGGYSDLHAILDSGLRINSRVRPEHMVVAETHDGKLAGFAYCFLSGLHRERYWVTTRVCDGHRREGLGTDLIRALGKVREEDRPFCVKMGEDNPAFEWVRSIGGVPFQVCPPMNLELTDAATQEWLAALPADERVVPGSALTEDQLVQSFSSMYEWVHEDWSPVTSRADVERVYAEEIRRALDRELSHFAVAGDEVVAGVFVFRTPVGEALDAVAETITRDAPDGASALTACVRATAGLAAEQGWDELAFDGHRDDPHLQPLLSGAPKLTGNALYYLEYEPPLD